MLKQVQKEGADGQLVDRSRRRPAMSDVRSTAQIREHRQITADLVAKPYYFRRWFCCVNRRCKTKLVMRDEFKVVQTMDNKGQAATQ